jgi:hypothetical protein
VAQLSDNVIVNVSIRVHDISDAGIGSGIHVSSVGIGRRKKHVTFNICVESLNASTWSAALRSPTRNTSTCYSNCTTMIARVATFLHLIPTRR